MTRKRTDFQNSFISNIETYRRYSDRLTELAISMFEWKNLPETIDERYLELSLFYTGSAIFFKDDALGFLALRMTTGGKLNVYGIPIKRVAYANNGYQKNLTESDSVIIWNNYLHTNSWQNIRQFSERLYNLDRTIDINVNAQKTPIIVQGTEKQRLSLINLYKSYSGNEPVIFGDTELDLTSLKSINTQAPYVSDRIYELKTQIWNEALTYLGINNTNQTKKERLISDEVIRNSGGTIASRYSRLEARRQSVKKINAMFGTNIEVNYRADYREVDNEIMITGDTEDNEQVHMMTGAEDGRNE